MGILTEAYDIAIKTRGRIANVQAVSSLKPNIMKTLMAHVGSVMFGESGVSRAEREMVAAVVSATTISWARGWASRRGTRWP